MSDPNLYQRMQAEAMLRRREEERHRQEDERRRQEEAQRQAEEQRRQEEERRRHEAAQKQTEEKRRQEEARRQADEARQAEERRQMDLAQRESELRKQAETAAQMARGQAADAKTQQGLAILAQTNPQEYAKLQTGLSQESQKASAVADVVKEQRQYEKKQQQQLDLYDRSLQAAESSGASKTNIEKAKTEIKEIKADFEKQKQAFRESVSKELMPFVKVDMVKHRRSTDGGRSYYEDTIPKLKVDVKGAVKVGVKESELKKIGVSQLAIVKAKKELRSAETARKVATIARPIEQAREERINEQKNAFKVVEKYYNPDTKQFAVTKAASEGITWETVKKAGFDIPKEEYESSKLRIVKPDKPQSYENAEVAFSKAADKIWKRKDLNADQKTEMVTQTREWQRLQDAQAIYAKTFEAGIMSKEFPLIAAEILVPGVYVARHWNELSPGNRALNIAIDVASLLPFAAAVTRGARMGATFGRAAMAKNIVRQLSAEALAQVTAPVDLVLHPVKTVKATGKQILNMAENIAHPKKIPYTVLTTTDGTVRIRIDGNTTAAQAVAARNRLMEEAIKGNRILVKVGDQTIEVATSPFMREARKAGGALAHATPGGESFEDVLTVLKKQGMPASEQGLFFANEPLPRFTLESAFGKVQATRPTIYIVSKETAQAMKGSNKIYRNTAELERILPVGAKTTGPQQRLITRIGPNADKVQLLLEKPLKHGQIAKLKAEGIIETVKAPFTPAIKYKGIQPGITQDELETLTRVLRQSGNVDQARNLLRLSTALRSVRTPVRPLTSVTGPVRPADITRAERILIDSSILLTSDLRTTKQKIKDSKERSEKEEDDAVRITDEEETSPEKVSRGITEEEPIERIDKAETKTPTSSVRPEISPEKTTRVSRHPEKPDLPESIRRPTFPERVTRLKDPPDVQRPPASQPDPSETPRKNEKGEKDWSPADIKSAIAWRDGFNIVALRHPYRRGIDEKSFHESNVPAGLVILNIRGKGSQQASAKVVGQLPKSLSVDVGNQDVHIVPVKKGQVRIEHVRDTRGTTSDLTIQRRSSGSTGRLRVSQTSGSKPRIISQKKGRVFHTRMGGDTVISRRPMRGY